MQIKALRMQIYSNVMFINFKLDHFRIGPRPVTADWFPMCMTRADYGKPIIYRQLQWLFGKLIFNDLT